MVMFPPAVVLVNPKYPHNVAAAIRACSCFGLETLLWTGSRVDPTEYSRLPREERMKGYREVQWRRTDRPFDHFAVTRGCGAMTVPVCVEIHEGSVSLHDFVHPRNAVYVFGPEDGGVPQVYRRMCHQFVHIPARHCLNLAAALNVVLYDRSTKLDPAFNCHVANYERRGEIPVPGWEGR